jgi:hypothetical protein
MMAAAGLANLALTERPNATESAASRTRIKNASSTSVAVTPPNKKGSAPTGTSITI